MTPPELATLRIDVDGAVGRLTLDRPEKLNALSPTMLAEIVSAARWFDEQPSVKVVVVTGAGDRAFSAGFDLTAFAAGAGDGDADRDVYAERDLGRVATDALADMTAVTIAAVRGHCVGGGVVLVSACDLRVATTDAVFSIPEVDLGIPLGWGGIPRLVRELGPAVTRELVMTCRPFDAAEAHRLRFVNQVVAPDELDEVTGALAASLADKSALVLRLTTRQIDEAAEQLVSTAAADRDAGLLALASMDAESRRAAMRALERRRR